MSTKLKRLDKIGEGTYSIIYRANDIGGEEKAVKRNLVEAKTSGIGSARELDILNALRGHPHVTQIQSVALDNAFAQGFMSPLQKTDQRDDNIHFVFELASYDLAGAIYENINGGPMDLPSIRWFLMQMIIALEYLHGRGYLHRDVKPGNFLIFDPKKPIIKPVEKLEVEKTETKTPPAVSIPQLPLPPQLPGLEPTKTTVSIPAPTTEEEEDEFVSKRPVNIYESILKICDLGLAKPATNSSICTPRLMTWWYRAPEVSLGLEYDGRADMWSVGHILYEMLSRNNLLSSVPDDDKEIIGTIIKFLPAPLSNNEKKMIGKFVKIPRRVAKDCKSYEKQISYDLRKLYGPDTDSLLELLNNLLVFDPARRWTATMALNHKFFDPLRFYITDCRNKFPPEPRKEIAIMIHQCPEREWAIGLIRTIYNSRAGLRWYNHRALFQGLDIYDRYLAAMFADKGRLIVTTIGDNKSPSTTNSGRGTIHTQRDAEIRFLACYYVAVKYFTSTQEPLKFVDMVKTGLPNFHLDEPTSLVVEQFEESLLRDCLRYTIYRETCYEAYGRCFPVAPLSPSVKVVGYTALGEQIVLELLMDFMKAHGKKYTGEDLARETRAKQKGGS